MKKILILLGNKFFLASLGLVTAGITITSLFAFQTYQLKEKSIEESCANEATVVAHRFQSVMQRLNATVSIVENNFPDLSTRKNTTPLHEAARTVLFGLTKDFPDIHGILIYDEHGYLTSSNITSIPVENNISTQQYFQNSKLPTKQKLYFSEVLTQNKTSESTVLAYRPVFGPEMDFQGLIVIPLNISLFAKMFSEVSVGNHGMVSMRRTDNSALVARFPETPSKINTTSPEIPPFQKIKNGIDTGIVRYIGVSDSIDRIFAFHKIDDSPFFILVGRSIDEQFAPWKRNIFGFGSLVAFAIACLILLTYKIGKQNSILKAQTLRAESMLQLPAQFENQSESEFLQYALDLVERLTSSKIAFVHFVNEDQETIELVTWSSRTLRESCNAAFDKHYPISKAGIWADAFRKRQPVVFNNYATYSKKLGLPEGHSNFSRLISVPVTEANTVVMLLGVGNKDIKYSDDDVNTTSLLANEIWRLVRRHRDISLLKKNEHRFEMLFNQAAMGMAMLSPDGRWIKVNKKLCEITGYSEIELLSKNYQDITFPEDLPLDIKASNDLLTGKIEFHTAEKRYVGPNGECNWVCIWVSLIRDSEGSPDYFVAAIEDIQKRRIAEVQLHKLALAVEQSPESVVITDDQGHIEYVNSAFSRITGYTPEQVLGKNPSMLQSGKTPRYKYADLWKALEEGREWRGEFHNRRADGSEYFVFAIITALQQVDGSIQYVAIEEDITDKKRQGEELDAYRHHLEELVSKRTSELELARNSAEIANRAKSTFLANMSHEIRTPLNGILGFAELLKRTENIAQKQIEYIQKIESSGKHLLSVINDVLDLAKIESGVLKVEKEEFLLSSLFHDVCSVIEFKAQSKGLSVQVAMDDAPNVLCGDRTRLAQALVNYMGNAVKFTDTGFIRLSSHLGII